MECVLCHGKFPSKLKLVQHFRETHSVAKHRPRRLKANEGIKRIIRNDDLSDRVEHLDEVTDQKTNTRGSLPLTSSENGLVNEISSESNVDVSHLCVQQLKQFVSCVYCGQKCKNNRGATIHQVFCEQRMGGPNQNIIHYECPADDCGAIFKGQRHFIKHVKKHHAEDGIKVIRSPTPPRLYPEKTVPVESCTDSTSWHVSKSPMVTVTMKPHIGKTDGLQDLSLLITPSKIQEETSEFRVLDKADSLDSVSGSNKDNCKVTTSITVEECLNIDGGLKGSGQAVLCVSEDGSVSQPSDNKTSDINNDKTFMLITGNKYSSNKYIKFYECKYCEEVFLEGDALSHHVAEFHKPEMKTISHIKEEPADDYCRSGKRKDYRDDDVDWEVISFSRETYEPELKLVKGKFEYTCKLCNRSFLCELSYQNHKRNEECRTKKFKLPRLFACHFVQCDSSFFKLTELQKHWSIAHKYTVASSNHEFEDEKTFLHWVSDEEEKFKVRFTCDVRRRKPHRTERLMVCHRFHTLRTAAARKAAKREYSDKHNWIHKIEPCLCYARMKVYQDFDRETCDYTGKISVVYYYEHSHPTDESSKEKEEILEHILQRNKRNRDILFQELKGNEKVQHRQKLEKFARIAGREYRASSRNGRNNSDTRKSVKDIGDNSELNVDQINCVHVGNNILESEGFFDAPVEMVLDGQFDMSHDVLSGPVVTHLDNISVFEGTRLKQDYDDHDNNNYTQDDDDDSGGDTSTVVLPASSEDWAKLFQFARSHVDNTVDPALKTEASLLLPYEKVIGLISPSEQIPIFRQLWELVTPALNSEEFIQVAKLNVFR